jgi:2'-5' RNA ligase
VSTEEGTPPRGETLRLFVAVPVPDDVRHAVVAAAAPLRRQAPRLRWIDPVRWHLTIAFLGWTKAGLLVPVEEALAAVAAETRPFQLGLDGGAGAFRSGVLWAGLVPSPSLAALAERVQARLAPLGFAFEQRSFHPHLTLARAPRGVRVPAHLPAVYEGPACRWAVDHIELQRSRVARAGATYELQHAWTLAKKA